MTVRASDVRPGRSAPSHGGGVRALLALVVLAVVVLLSVAGCGEAPRCRDRCGGDGGSGMDAGIDAGRDASGPRDAAPDAPDAPALDGGADGGGGPPVFPDVIDHLSFAIRTADLVNAAADGTDVSLCLDATHCYRLDVNDVDDFRRGEIDVYHHDGVDLPRSAVDRVELRWASGADAWQPSCIEVRFDGEPVHCQDGLDVTIGDGAGESPTWRDPAGLHEACVTCYPSRLTHGPLVGGVGPSTARILVRTDATRPVTLELTDPASPAPRILGPQYPDPRDDYTTTFVIDGLAPRTAYSARARVGGTALGRTATFRTAPREGDAGTFQFGLGSCANDTNFPVQPVYRAIDADDLDLFLFLGDNHYANSGDHQALWWRYRGTLEMPARAAFLASTPSIAIWDDHDYCGNDTTRHAPGRNDALRAFRDYWANPAGGTADTRGIFFRTSYGDVDFFMLDDRYWRDTPGTAGASMLGEAQHAWLEAELLASTATFRVIVSGSIFTRAGETWLDYPDSRSRLFAFIRARDIGGVVFLAGDVHRSHYRWIHRPLDYDIPELVSSGLATAMEGACPGPDAAEPDAAQVFCTQATPTYMTLDVDTTRADPRIVAHIRDVDGTDLRALTILRSQLQ